MTNDPTSADSLKSAKQKIDFIDFSLQKSEKHLGMGPQYSRRCDEIQGEYRAAVAALRKDFGVTYNPRKDPWAELD